MRDGDHILEGDIALKKHITTYYKGLFGPADATDVTLDESHIHDIPQVSDVENSALISVFTEE